MTTYRYLKIEPRSPAVLELNLRKKKKQLRFLSAVFLVGGLVLLANATWPIITYRLEKQADIKPELLSPISQMAGSVGVQVLGQEAPEDYRHPGNWFPAAPSLVFRPSRITHYTISIPELKIINAVATIGGEDLMESLIHYPGTALPGQKGNVVIFGHSTLPQFYNPKNYKTIFSTLPTIKKGDEILVDFDGISYRYLVMEKQEVKPTDVSVLRQDSDGYYLSLVTCVPPGYYSRRLVVRTVLI
jgi:sortase A